MRHLSDLQVEATQDAKDTAGTALYEVRAILTPDHEVSTNA